MIGTNSLVTFRIAGTAFAFPVRDVVEVTAARAITPVPGSGRALAGVTSWRGHTIPVLDLGAILKGSPRSSDEKSRLVILSRPETFAVTVDETGRVLRESGIEEVEGAEEAGPMRGIRLVRGESGLLRVLDAPKLLEQARAASQESR